MQAIHGLKEAIETVLQETQTSIEDRLRIEIIDEGALMVHNQTVSFTEEIENFDASVSMTSEVYMNILTEKLNPFVAVTLGKLKVSGNVMKFRQLAKIMRNAKDRGIV